MPARASLNDLEHLQSLLIELPVDDGRLQRLRDWVATAIDVRVAQKTRSRTPFHDDLMDAYETAKHQWEIACENATNGYGAEIDEFRRQHPRPTLRGFLEATRRRSDVCPLCGQPFPAEPTVQLAEAS